MANNKLGKIGIIGGTGKMGTALAKQMLELNFVKPYDLWVSNRSGKRNEHFDRWPQVAVTKNNEELLANCQTIILTIQSEDVGELKIDASKHLVVSAIPTLSTQDLNQKISANKIVRTMPTNAIEVGLSYTPWFATETVTSSEQEAIQVFLETFGTAKKIQDENLLDTYFKKQKG